MLLQVDRVVLIGDARQISRCRVAPCTAARALKVGLACFGIPGEQFRQRIPTGNTVAVLRGQHLMMQEGDDVIDLTVRQIGKARHASLDDSLTDNWPDGAAVIVVAYDRGPREVRSPRPFGIVSMAEAASGLKLSPPAFDGCHIFDRVFSGRLMGGLHLRIGERYESQGKKKGAHTQLQKLVNPTSQTEQISIA